MPVRGFPTIELAIGAESREGEGALKPAAGGRNPETVRRPAPKSDVAGLDAADFMACTGLAGLTGAVCTVS